MCKVVVLFIKPIASLPFSLLSPSSLLKLPITFSIKRETRQFHVVVEKEKKNVPRFVLEVQSCSFANINLLLF